MTVGAVSAPVCRDARGVAHAGRRARWRAAGFALWALVLGGVVLWSAPAGAQTPTTPKRVTGFDLASGNSSPTGVWGNDDTIWVANNGSGAGDKIFAYNRSDGSRDAAGDFDTLNAAGNADVRGICSDGTTMFVADSVDSQVYAYKMSDTTRDSAKDITLDSGNGNAEGIWCDSSHVWVAQDSDSTSSKIFAYQRSDRSHASAMDIGAGTMSPSSMDGALNNSDPRGLWSNATTLFAVDREDRKVYAYETSTRTRDATKDLALASGNADPEGLWFDGRVLWVADIGDDRVYVYDLPGAQPDNTPAVGDPAVGIPRVGIELTADVTGITDTVDSLTNAVFHYQWIRVDGTDEADIDGETGSTYTPTDDDLGKHLKVRVVFDDDAGYQEYPRTSPQVGPVADPAVTVAFEMATYSVGEGTIVSVKVQLSAEPGREVIVPLTATNRAGASGSDYSVPASVTFNDDETEKSFTFLATDDTVDDDDEWVLLGFGTLPADVTEGTLDEASVSIIDDDDPEVTVAFEQDTQSVAEGGTVAVKVTLRENPERSVAIPITTTNENGASDSDYSGVPENVTFNAGETEKSFTFLATDDTVDDDGESVRLGFGTLPARVTAGTTDEATVSIIDDDDPAVTVSFEMGSYPVGEGASVEVKVQLNANPERTVIIPITRSNQDGASNSDHSGVPASVTFNRGETEKSFTVSATQDTVDDDDESVRLGFGPLPARVTAGTTSEATVTITDDDANRAAMGAPTIVGTARVGEMLIAGTSAITDVDGLGTFVYQWVRVDGMTDTNVGADSSTYTVVEADLGKRIRVDVTFDDAADSAEGPLSSAPTDAVVAAVAVPNNQATGTPTISGPERVDGAIRADTSAIDDSDGITNMSFLYQWEATEGEFSTTFGAIAGAAGSSHKLTVDQQNRRVRVVVSFIDDAGHLESVTSEATGPIAGNATAPTITGIERVQGELTAGTSSIFDPQGVDTTSFEYEWQANIGSPDSTIFLKIADATESAYTLTGAQQDRRVRVVVRFTDNDGNSEEVTSVPTEPIATGAPTITGTETVGRVLSVDLTTMVDSDGFTNALRDDAFTYVWSTTGGPGHGNSIAGATSKTYRLAPADTGHRIFVSVAFTDDANNPETRTSALTGNIAAATSTNASPVGLPAIDGILRVHESLEADHAGVSDADGLGSPSDYTYAWIRVHNGMDLFISGATSDTYTLTGGDLGSTIKVRFGFTDGGGTTEAVTSIATGVIDGPIGVTVATSPATDPPALTVDEGSTGTYTLVLTDQPSAGVTVAVTAGGDVTVEPAGVTFTTADWNTAQTVTVSAGHDLDETDDTVTLTHTATRPDVSNYNISIANVVVTVTDTGSTAPNNAASGEPEITGNARVNSVLTASPGTIDDTDGLTNATYRYQWIRVDRGTDLVLSGSTGSTYTLTPNDVGKRMKVTATFTDDGGNTESRTSAPTAIVAPAPTTGGGTTGGGGGSSSFGGGGGGGGGDTPPEPEPVPDRFGDDDGSVHEASINKIAAAGITVGCNPPDSDRFCPGQSVTRAQMASFLARALDLPDTDTDYFGDDDGSVHEASINKIAAAGITVGCNPPDSDRFCPGQSVTRAQMASFLARALDLPDTDTDYFGDDDGSVHEASINKIAAAGITVGCNPPDSDRFCPGQSVTRAQMASFLARALDLH